MNNKNTGKSKNRRFQRPGLIFYCYLLIPLNELAPNVLNINKIKNEKKFIDISMVSIQNAGKGIFNYELQITNNFSEANYGDTPLTSRLSGQALLIEGNSGRASLKCSFQMVL
jgi:hypothetical protein